MFSGTFHGPDGISKFVEDRETGLLEETGRCPEGIKSYRAIALTSVMSKWYASCIILRLKREKEPEKWKNLHVDGVDGISCQHLQVMVTNLLQKHWEWQEERNPVLRHGTVVRPMYLASLDIKRALDDAKTKHVAKILDYHNTHGWLIAALLRCRGWKARPCLNAWKAALVSTDACDKEAWQPPRLWQ